MTARTRPRARPTRKRAFLESCMVLASCAVLCTRASSARAEDLQRGSTSNSIGRSLLAGSKYDRGDDIALFANKVGPFHNPSEVRARFRASTS